MNTSFFFAQLQSEVEILNILLCNKLWQGRQYWP